MADEVAIAEDEVRFALAPGLVEDQVIDFGTAYGMRFYQSATSSLYGSGETKFNSEPGNMNAFLSKIDMRAQEQGWSEICSIPEDTEDEDNDTFYSLFDEYGRVSLEQVTNHAETFVGEPTRNAQNSYMMFNCLAKSLDEDALNKMAAWEDDYYVGQVPVGPLFLKVIIRETVVDNNATVRSIRTNLRNIDEYLPTIGNDITKLNVQVKQWVKDLNARGARTEDLLDNLFRAYKKHPDTGVHVYVEHLESQYDSGEGNITVNRLMHLVANKFETRKVEPDYEKGMAEDEKILALQAMEARFDQKFDKVMQCMETKLIPDGNNAGGGRQRNSGGRGKEPWMTVKPTQSEVSAGYVKTVKGKEWKWCSYHGYWCAHLSEACRDKERLQKEKENGNSNKKGSKMLKAAAALMMEEDEDYEDDDE